jgi:hypothetical protein
MDTPEQRTREIRASNEPGKGAGSHRGSAAYRPLGPESERGARNSDQLSRQNGQVVVESGIATRDHCEAVGALPEVDDAMGNQLPVACDHDHIAQTQLFEVRRLDADRLPGPQRGDHAGATNVKPEPCACDKLASAQLDFDRFSQQLEFVSLRNRRPEARSSPLKKALPGTHRPKSG